MVGGGFVYEHWRKGKLLERRDYDCKMAKAKLVNEFTYELGDIVKVKHAKKGLCDRYKYSLEGVLLTT